MQETCVWDTPCVQSRGRWWSRGGGCRGSRDASLSHSGSHTQGSICSSPRTQEETRWLVDQACCWGWLDAPSSLTAQLHDLRAGHSVHTAVSRSLEVATTSAGAG